MIKKNFTNWVGRKLSDNYHFLNEYFNYSTVLTLQVRKIQINWDMWFLNLHWNWLWFQTRFLIFCVWYWRLNLLSKYSASWATPLALFILCLKEGLNNCLGWPGTCDPTVYLPSSESYRLLLLFRASSDKWTDLSQYTLQAKWGLTNRIRVGQSRKVLNIFFQFTIACKMQSLQSAPSKYLAKYWSFLPL
jgi:hypothetical protein